MFNFKNSNSGKIRVKLLAILLVLTLTFANFALVGSYIGEAIAAEIDLNNQDSSTNDNENVSFELYFDETNKTNQVSKDINAKDLVLYASVNVFDGGVLKNAKIELADIDTNFELQDSVNSESLNLGTIQSGEGETLELPVEFKECEDTFNLGLLNMISKIRLTGEYTNNEGEIVPIDTTKYVQVNWTSQAIDLIPEGEKQPIDLAQELITNKIYTVGQESKRVIQYKITSGITDNQYPIKSTTIELQAPKYDETTKEILTEEQIVEGVNAIAPEKAIVAAYSLNATNPNAMLSFGEYEQISEENIGFVYNEQTGELNINVTNKANEEKNEATWGKGNDEFIVTYIYPEDVVVENLEITTNSKIALHDLDNRVLTAELTKTEQITNQTQDFGDIITFETSANESIYKSNMYVGEETIYNTKVVAKISCVGVAENIKIISGADKLTTAEDLEVDAQTYYKNTYISKQELDYILGEQGSLKIYDNSNLDEPIAEINNQTESTENGIIVVNYENEVETVLIEITNPAKAGVLNIYNQKAVKKLISDEMTEETVNAILEEISSAKKLDIATRLFAMQGETEIVKENIATNTIQLQEPVSDAEFGISKTELSTIQENDINFTITLKTDDIKYDLYENPVITITLPEIVDSVEVDEEDITILNSDELELQKLDKYIITDGNTKANTIVLTLIGKQTKYTNTNTQISINAKLRTQELIPTMSKDIIMTVGNGKSIGTVYPNNGVAVLKTQQVNFEAEQGVLLATSLSNYNTQNESVTLFEEDSKTIVLETGKEAKVATVIGTVINNTKTDLEEIVVFGKVQNEGTSINTALNSEILVQNILGENENLVTEVYYTEDANPTIESAWTNTPNANTTAYKIVCKNVAQASVLVFGFNIVIPENLDTNKETLINYEVINNNQTITAPEIKLQTPKEIKLDLELTANVQNGEEVYEGQNIVYNVKVTNSGEVDAENVTLNIVAEGLTIIEGQNQFTNLNIKAGETIEQQIKATVNEGATQTSLTAQVSTDYLLQETKATIVNTVAKPGIKLEVNKTISTYSEDTIFAQIGSKVIYTIGIENISNGDLNNIQIIDKLAEELEVEDIYIESGEGLTKLELENIYNEQAKAINVEIDNLKSGEKILVSIYTNVEKVVDTTIVNTAYITTSEYPDVTFSCIDTTNVKGMPIITSSVTANKQGNLNSGDIIEYTIKVKNEGETTESITVESVVPEELEVQNAYYYYAEGENHEVAINLNKAKLYSMNLEQNQELTLKIKAKVKETELNTNIKNQVTITGQYIEEIKQEVENTVIGTGKKPEGEQGENPGNNPGQSTEYTYSISGIAWQDDNSNGARENEEKLLKNIKIKLLNAETNEYISETSTDEQGKYEFKDLESGKYIVIFEYNQTTYSVTGYQKAEVESRLNSDARLVTEENKNIVKTDILQLINSNISNIDIGLIVNPIFDLKLDKYITKVSVQNSRGTEIYEYNKTQLAKVEIPAKVLEGSIVIVEYQIDVTNEGAVPAHVDSIVDYVSPQFEFKSELNTTWYKANDNNLYCIEFANKDVEPGETISSKLVLTKTMTNDNTGLIDNAAEIYETFNEYAFEDIDSIPANRAQEDDLSQADIIISIKTGGPLLYIGIVIISMFILSAGIYLINKKVIKNHII